MKMNKEILRPHVIKFIEDILDEKSVYFKVSEGEFDIDAEYTNKNCLMFVISYFRKHDDTPCDSELVHVIKKAKGFQLINASSRNFYPSKDDCMAYQFIKIEE